MGFDSLRIERTSTKSRWPLHHHVVLFLEMLDVKKNYFWVRFHVLEKWEGAFDANVSWDW